MRPEMSAYIGEVPVSHGLKLQLAVTKRIDRLEPISLHRFGPGTMPAGNHAFGPHACGVEAVGGIAGNFADVERAAESGKSIQHRVDLEEIVLGIIKLETDTLELCPRAEAIF